MQNYMFDHFLLQARLLQHPTWCHAHYLRVRQSFLLKLPPAVELRGVDAKFQTIKLLDPVPPTLKRPPLPLWMSPKSIRMVYKRASIRRNPIHNCNMSRGLTKAAHQYLLLDSQRRS